MSWKSFREADQLKNPGEDKTLAIIVRKAID
jgi:hypothetical protein